MTEKIDLVLSGSGTLLPCHIGAVAALQDNGFEVRRVAGTSGGAVVAAGIAHGMTKKDMLDLSVKFLNKKLLTRNYWPPIGWGLHGNERIKKLLREVFPGKMRDAHMPFSVFTVDVTTQEAVRFARNERGGAPVADVVTASAAIPGFFNVVTIPGYPGVHVDGGVRANFAMKVWDDDDRCRTVGVRFRHRHVRRPVRGLRGYVAALASTFIDNANHTFISEKAHANVIEIDSDGDGMEFDLTREEIADRYREGYKSALKWIREPVIG